MEPIDPAWSLDRRAQIEGWPLRCDAGKAFDRQELNDLRDAWCALAERKGIPARSDFDARTLRPCLRNIIIIERVMVDDSHWRYRVRLAGQTIVDTLGDISGRFTDENIPAELVPRWSAAYDAALASTRPLRVVADFEAPKIDFLRGEALLAPLADQAGKVSMALICVYFMPRRVI